jgi:DNA-binding NarL/FixJ family response regulator
MLNISLGSIPNLKVVGAVPDGRTAIKMADKLKPDVVLMDIELSSDPNGITAGRAIKQAREDTGIIVLSAHKEREYVDLVSKGGYAGWSDLLKQSVTDAGALVRAIEGLSLRSGGNGPLGGQQHAAAQRLSHRPAHPPTTRGIGDDGPRVQ